MISSILITIKIIYLLIQQLFEYFSFWPIETRVSLELLDIEHFIQKRAEKGNIQTIARFLYFKNRAASQ